MIINGNDIGTKKFLAKGAKRDVRRRCMYETDIGTRKFGAAKKFKTQRMISVRKKGN